MALKEASDRGVQSRIMTNAGGDITHENPQPLQLIAFDCDFEGVCQSRCELLGF